MRNIRYLMISVFALLCVLSCKKEVAEEVGYGYLYVSLDRDSEEDLVFKSTPVEELVFALDVYNSLGTKVASVPDYKTLATEPLTLPAGNFFYEAVAYSGTDGAAAFDKPFYSGSTKFKVTKDQVSNIDITASLANVKVTAAFDEKIKAGFKEYKLTVSNGKGELVFDNTAVPSTIDKEGFFSVTGTLTWKLRMVNNDGQVYEELTDTYTDVKAKQHYNLSFSLKQGEDFGGGAVTIVLDDSLNQKEYDMSLDFGDGPRPSVTSPNFSIDKGDIQIIAGDLSPRTLNISSADGFESIILSYTSGDASKTAGKLYELVQAEQAVIDELKAAGITAVSVKKEDTSAEIVITDFVSNLSVGRHEMTLRVVENSKNHSFVENTLSFTVMSNVDVQVLPIEKADIWARHATVKAKWFPEVKPEGISFQYMKKGDPQWTDFNGTVVPDEASRTYTAEIRGLEPSTEYLYRAVCTSTAGKETMSLGFTTESAETLHNMSFDFWYMSGKAPMPNESSSFAIWDSANKGSATFGIIPTNEETTDLAVPGEGKKAAKLTTLKAPLVGLAAGNLYTGSFGGLAGAGAKLNWGVPFASRPLALRGHYKYLPKTVNIGSHAGMNGQTDICQIQIMLTDWDQPFLINTKEGVFVDVQNDPHIIAYGSLERQETMSGYEQFTIKLDYRDKTRTPKYIVIVAASSKYGDYFTGGEGSTLYLDEFEFVYDPNQLGTE